MRSNATMIRTQRPRLVEVARFAGVSSATVSRALTQPQLLSEATLAKVNRAIDSLGYVSDASARTLASGRSGMVGAVVPTIHNAVFARAIHHLQMGLAEGGLQLVLAAHEYNPAVEAQAIRMLLTRGVDALVLVGAERPRETWELLSGHRARVFLTYTFHKDYDSIGFDNAKAGYLAARHLIDLGHRSIGFISGPRRSNDRMALRLKGAIDGLSHWHESGDNGVDTRVLHLSGATSVQGALAALKTEVSISDSTLLPAVGVQALNGFRASATSDLEEWRATFYDGGPVPAADERKRNGVELLGQTLLDMQSDDYSNTVTQQQSKALMRTLINHCLGDQVLHTRQLLRDLQQL